MNIDENTIWGSRQNHPELVIIDFKKYFNMDEESCNKMRFILMNRGINKWLYARRRFIKLKHKVKAIMKQSIQEYGHKHPLVKEIKRIQAEMQNIAKAPRWVEWGTHVYKNMSNNEKEIIVRGNPC